MNFANCRFCAVWMLAALFMLTASSVFAQDSTDPSPNGTVPVANRLQNADFECGAGGYYESQNSRGSTILLPNQWTLAANGDVPVLYSARIYFEKRANKNGGCETRNAHVERISGDDSAFVSSLDIETPPEPGKPFDVSLWQQVDTISGTAYSLSGWMLTLCGGSNTVPKNDCPQGYYMEKVLGIDPTGATDPNAATVVWGDKNRNNFVDSENKRIGWANLSTSAMAAGNKVTVFARINSPFQWHGNHGFIDALDLVQAPTVALTVITTTAAARTMTVTWDGSLGSDIPEIDGGNFQPYYDVQYWHPRNGEWRDLQSGATQAGTMTFAARCTNDTYRFRARTRAEQPEGVPGAWPNQRFPGVWSEPIDVFVPPVSLPAPAPVDNGQIYLPALHVATGC